AKPAGDDVVTPATVAAPTYGCTFTKNTTGPDDANSTVGLRQIISLTTPACPS
ncbi:MAG TPA: alpha/beta hydrolase, partial [Rhizobacter sp.]|nr:alpha/beta hydrolase [Rhizobacter sp.]